MSKNTKALEALSSATKTLIFAVEEINRAVSQLSSSKKTFDSRVHLSLQCSNKSLPEKKVQQGINEGILGMPGEKYRKANGLPKPLNDNLTVSQVQQKMFANVFAVEIISDDPRASIPTSEAKPIGLRAGTLARVLKEDCDVRKLLNNRADALLKIHAAKSKVAATDEKIIRKIRKTD